MGRYRINEIFYSLQGEGIRAGTPNIFVRFSGCNMQCAKEPGDKSPGGFDCDTEFESGTWVESDEDLLSLVQGVGEGCRNIIWTGGEPSLQLTESLIKFFKVNGFYQSIESNGSRELPGGLDWISVSPKVAEHALRQKLAHEVKYVRAYGQGIPKPAIQANHYLISPAFDDGLVTPQTLAWCIKLVKENPQWRLSIQQHKLWKVR